MKQFKRKLAVPIWRRASLFSAVSLQRHLPTAANLKRSHPKRKPAPLEEPAIDRSTATEEGNHSQQTGIGQLQDQADSSQNKIFYTITTKNNNTYFPYH